MLAGHGSSPKRIFRKPGKLIKGGPACQSEAKYRDPCYRHLRTISTHFGKSGARPLRPGSGLLITLDNDHISAPKTRANSNLSSFSACTGTCIVRVLVCSLSSDLYLCVYIHLNIHIHDCTYTCMYVSLRMCMYIISRICGPAAQPGPDCSGDFR